MATRTNTRRRCATTGSSQPKRRAVLIIEDDAELRRLTVALLEEGELETIECESAAAPTRMVSPAGLAPTSGDIVTRGRICWFESYMPSQAVRSRLGNCDRYDPAIGSLRSVDPKATTPNSQSPNFCWPSSRH